MFVKVIINGKEVSVYEAEAPLLLEKGLATLPSEEKAITEYQNKAVVPNENKTQRKNKKR